MQSLLYLRQAWHGLERKSRGSDRIDNTYSNGHPERLRTDDAVGFYVDFSYSDLVDARVGVIPKYNRTEDSKEAYYTAAGSDDAVYLNSAAGEDTIGLIVSALVKPIDGVQVSASYALNPSSTADSWAVGKDIDHGWAMAANVNITDIIGIDDWSVGVEVTYVGIYNQTAEEEGLNDDIGAIIAATVYGGWQFIDAGVEYGIAINRLLLATPSASTRMGIMLVSSTDRTESDPTGRR